MQGTELAANVHMLVSKHSDSLETDTGRLSHDKLAQHRRQHGTAASQIGERYGKESKSYLPWPTHSESFIYYSVCSLGLARENAMQQKFICLMHWCVGAVQLLLYAHSMHSLVINLFLMHWILQAWSQPYNQIQKTFANICKYKNIFKNCKYMQTYICLCTHTHSLTSGQKQSCRRLSGWHLIAGGYAHTAIWGECCYLKHIRVAGK